MKTIRCVVALACAAAVTACGAGGGAGSSCCAAGDAGSPSGMISDPGIANIAAWSASPGCNASTLIPVAGGGVKIIGPQPNCYMRTDHLPVLGHAPYVLTHDAHLTGPISNGSPFQFVIEWHDTSGAALDNNTYTVSWTSPGKMASVAVSPYGAAYAIVIFGNVLGVGGTSAAFDWVQLSRQ